MEAVGNERPEGLRALENRRRDAAGCYEFRHSGILSEWIALSKVVAEFALSQLCPHQESRSSSSKVRMSIVTDSRQLNNEWLKTETLSLSFVADSVARRLQQTPRISLIPRESKRNSE